MKRKLTKLTYAIDIGDAPFDPNTIVENVRDDIEDYLADTLWFTRSNATSNNKITILANSAAKEIQSQYRAATAAMGNEKSSAPVVTVEQLKNGARITASGPNVFFCEYGIGDDAAEYYPSGIEKSEDIEVSPGSWSRTHHTDENGNLVPGPYSQYGYWFYRGKSYTGVPGTHAMFNAELLIKDLLKDTIEEPFR